MSRDAQAQAKQNVKMAQGAATTAGQNAAGIYGNLTPFLQNQLQNPQGFGDQAVNEMKTNATEGAGGGEAAAQGLLSLNAERTRNNAGFSAAADKSARDAESNIMTANQGVDIANQKAKLDQQAQAASGLQGLFGTNIGAQTGNLNSANEGVNAEVNAGKTGWYQNLLSGINAVKPGYSSSGGFSAGG